MEAFSTKNTPFSELLEIIGLVLPPIWFALPPIQELLALIACENMPMLNRHAPISNKLSPIPPSMRPIPISRSNVHPTVRIFRTNVRNLLTSLEISPPPLVGVGVTEDPIPENGYLSINYSDIVPLLIESIKQQQVQIEELKKQLSYANTNKIVSKSFLEQNNPNLFAALTDLPYFIDESDKASNAVVTVYDKDGNLYKSFPVEAKAGFGKISFDCTACNTGLYIYTLQLNSKVVDTKVMLLYR